VPGRNYQVQEEPLDTGHAAVQLERLLAGFAEAETPDMPRQVIDLVRLFLPCLAVYPFRPTAAMVSPIVGVATPASFGPSGLHSGV